MASWLPTQAQLNGATYEEISTLMEGIYNTYTLQGLSWDKADESYLKDRCDDWGISNDGEEEDLRERLQEAQALFEEELEEEPEEELEEEPVKKTVKVLKQEAKDLKIVGYSTMKKQELIDAIEEANKNSDSEDSDSEDSDSEGSDSDEEPDTTGLPKGLPQTAEFYDALVATMKLNQGPDSIEEKVQKLREMD